MLSRLQAARRQLPAHQFLQVLMGWAMRVKFKVYICYGSGLDVALLALFFYQLNNKSQSMILSIRVKQYDFWWLYNRQNCE